MVHVCACMCIYGHGCMLVCICMCLCRCVPVHRCLCVDVGAGPRPFPGIWSLWPHLLQLPKMTEAESPWGAWKTRLKGIQGPSVCLSFSPRNENPSDLRALQLSAHYLPARLGPNHIPVPFGRKQGISRGVPDGPEEEGVPFGTVLFGTFPVWARSGELAVGQSLVGRNEEG